MRGVVGTRTFFPVICRSYVSPGYSLNLGLVRFGLALLTLVNLRALDSQQKLAFCNFFFSLCSHYLYSCFFLVQAALVYHFRARKCPLSINLRKYQLTADIAHTLPSTGPVWCQNPCFCH